MVPRRFMEEHWKGVLGMYWLVNLFGLMQAACSRFPEPPSHSRFLEPLSHSRFLEPPSHSRYLESSSHSRFPDFRIFFVKKSGKIVKIVFFGLPGPIFCFVFLIFLYDRYFLYKPLFLSSQPSKTLKIELTISKSTRGTTYSSFRPSGTPFRPDLPPKIVFFRFFCCIV